MTTKQTKTLVLFAQNYSLVVIAKKMGVCLTTIRERLKALAKNHQKEFNNALGVREVYKRNRDALRNTINFSSLFVGREMDSTVGKGDGFLSADSYAIENITKETF